MTLRWPLALLAGTLLFAACSPAASEETPQPTFAPLESTTQAPVTTTTVAPPTTGPTTTTTTLPPNECDPAPAAGPDEGGFFSQRCTVLGFEVIASAAVDSEALVAAADRFHATLVHLPEIRAALDERGLRITVIGAEERTTDLPPFADLYELYPGTDWDRTTRSFAATGAVPWVAAAEENLLCAADDRHAGEDMFLRDLARTVRDFGLREVDPAFDLAIEQTYSRVVITQGLWASTLAENNSDTYWMEGIQSYFDGNLEADPADTAHNHVDTRAELAAYDQLLFDLARTLYGSGNWRSPCA